MRFTRGTDPPIEGDIAAAKGIGGKATPWIVINGMQYPGAADSANIMAIIDSILKGGD